MEQSAFAGEPGRSDVVGDPLPQFALQRLGTICFRTAEKVICLRVSPDSSRALLAVEDLWESDRNSPLLYDLVTGKLLQTLSRHERPVQSVNYSPDGTLIASAGFDGAIRIWDRNSSTQLRALRGSFESPVALAFSPDCANLFTALYDDGSICIWDLSSGRETHRLHLAAEYLGVDLLAVSPDGRTLARGG